jgi:hypothetical protein
MVIIQRKTYETDLFEERGFIDRALLQLWAMKLLFLEVERRRAYFSYAVGAVVIIDGCTCHDSDWFLDDALARSVGLHWLPSHSSDETQPLDLGLFRLTKQAIEVADPDVMRVAHRGNSEKCNWEFPACWVSCTMGRGQERLMTEIVPAEADRAQEGGGGDRGRNICDDEFDEIMQEME